MRTTINLDDDILAMARAVAETRKISLGKAVSNLARQGATAPPRIKHVDGFPMFEVGEGAKTFGLEEMEAAEEAEDLEMARFFIKKPTK